MHTWIYNISVCQHLPPPPLPLGMETWAHVHSYPLTGALM